MTSYHAGRVTHAVRAVPRVATSGGKSLSSTVRPRPRQARHELVAFISLIALVVGLIPAIIWDDEAYCRRHPWATPGMHLDRPCYEVLATSSTWEGVVGVIGVYIASGSLVGFAVALWWYLQHHIRKR
jgi:hypothetical protein